MRVISGIVGLALPLLVAGGYVWQRAADRPADTETPTVRVRRETLDRAVIATGVIRPVVGAEIQVGSRVSGIVRAIPVEVGDRVDRGELLARIDPTEFEAELAQARADLSLARAELMAADSAHERARSLASDGVVSTTDLETATRDLEIARARVERETAKVDSAEIRLACTEIRAPIAGVIAEVTTREGETVAASFAAPTFVTIVDLDRLEVQAYVDETDVGRISVGQAASFTVDTYPEAEFSARVVAVNPKAELQNGVVNYVVRLAFDPQDAYALRPEMTAHVRVLSEQRQDVLTLPRRAIRRDDGRPSVRVLRGGEWVDQDVEAGWRTEDRVEIRAGLAEGETVQLNPE